MDERGQDAIFGRQFPRTMVVTRGIFQAFWEVPGATQSRSKALVRSSEQFDFRLAERDCLILLNSLVTSLPNKYPAPLLFTYQYCMSSGSDHMRSQKAPS